MLEKIAFAALYAIGALVYVLYFGIALLLAKVLLNALFGWPEL